MPESLKQIKSRIRSIQSTKKVTNAMQMVSAVKLNRTDKALVSLRSYLAGMESVLTDLVNSREEINNPYFRGKGLEEKSILLCVITSDSGLCGLYNNNVLRQAEDFLQNQGGKDIRLILIGKKSAGYFRAKGLTILHTYAGLNGIYNPLVSDEIAAILANLFSAGEADAVYIASSYFKNAFIQNAGVRKLLNIEIQKGPRTEFIMEQPFDELLTKAATRYIITKMRMVLLEAFCCEHAARSLAMKLATDNAQELLEALTLVRNKIRQANITQEMMEIISSTEALRG
ncbi:MAG TPA: ATP synthase F1 subunit gamma [Candidatus Margulisiibacteriota bacterium]|nr:ATP synthase F1 subunit gamma [Candidatus Margulisiibacteriota bacterium]